MRYLILRFNKMKNGEEKEAVAREGTFHYFTSY